MPAALELCGLCIYALCVCDIADASPSSQEFQDLWTHLSLIIDGGPIGDGQSPECRLGSTVVDLSVPGKFGIIRPGW